MLEIKIDNDLCTGCKICKSRCPEDVLDMINDSLATVVALDRRTVCMECEQGCPLEVSISQPSAREVFN